MTSFSSWGPTDDGRIKPDVVAAGCENDGRDTCEDIYTDPSIGIWSTVPDNLYTDYCPPPDDIDDFQYPYSAMCGTSMSTPAVSGSVALMLEDWRENHSGQPDPLPSTIKAILIQTATDLGNPGPDYSYGYGQINVTDAIDLIREDTSNDVILEDSIIERGDIDIFGVTVPEEQSELKITLVWDDYPGDPARPEALVNDLDLVVRAPDHTRHYPWTLDPAHPGVDAGRGDPDNINNVEQVFVGNPTSGTWRIEISETKLPQPGQLYSLVSNLGFGPAPPYAYDGSVLTETNTDVEILLEGSDDGLPTPPGVLTYIVTSLPSQGTLSDPGAGAISSVPYTLVDNGNQVIYMPNTDYLGPDSFEFKANDGGTAPDGGDSNEATINVYVFGVVNWWKFDETSGTTAHDSGVGHNDGVVHGAAWITGQIDGGLDFDGNNDYVDFDLGALEALKGDSVTISAWIWVEAGDLYCPIVRQYDFEGWDHFGYDLYVGRGGEAYFYLDNTYARCTDDRISSGEWRHLAGTYDGQELRIYLDGALKDSTSYAGTGRNTDAYIGYGIYGENEDDYYFDGIIDDVRVYKGAVDVDEIWDKMYYGTSKFSVVDSSGVRVAWFDDLGNLFLKGTLTRETTPTATANDEFRLQDSEDNDVAIIDATNGNMEIFGLLKLDSDNEWEDPNEEKDEFIIYDDADPLNPVAYIDELGDLYLKGQLYEVEP